jgi:hypothetical protein
MPTLFTVMVRMLPLSPFSHATRYFTDLCSERRKLNLTFFFQAVHFAGGGHFSGIQGIHLPCSSAQTFDPWIRLARTLTAMSGVLALDPLHVNVTSHLQCGSVAILPCKLPRPVENDELESQIIPRVRLGLRWSEYTIKSTAVACAAAVNPIVVRPNTLTNKDVDHFMTVRRLHSKVRFCDRLIGIV